MVHGTEDGKDYLSIMPRIKGPEGNPGWSFCAGSFFTLLTRYHFMGDLSFLTMRVSLSVIAHVPRH
jgi:hypothetical protein